MSTPNISAKYPASQAIQSQEPLGSFICPITFEVMKEPVIDRHGHTFEKAAIENWLKSKKTCPMNQQTITEEDLTPNRALKEAIELLQAREVVEVKQLVDEKNAPRPLGKEQNDNLAQPLLKSALELVRKNQLADAEKLYLMAIQFTSKSADYAFLPALFERKKEESKAASAYVILADLQIGEGKQAEAVASLKKSLKLVADPNIKEKLAHLLKRALQNQEASSLFLEMAQQALYNKDALNATRFCNLAIDASPGHAEAWKTLAAVYHDSTEATKILLKGANEPSMPLKERIAICKMVLIKEPDNLKATLLLLNLKQLKMKDKITRLQKELALESLFRTYGAPLGKAMWEKYFGDVGTEPPLPPNLIEILNSPCPFWPDKTVKDTHVLVLIPKTVNGKPLSLMSFGELLKHPKKGTAAQYKDFKGGILTVDKAVETSYWILKPKKSIPESPNQNYFAEEKLLTTYNQKANVPYEVPNAIDVVVSSTMQNIIKSDLDDRLSFCKETITEGYQKPSYQLAVGIRNNYLPPELKFEIFGHHYTPVEFIALTPVRKFTVEDKQGKQVKELSIFAPAHPIELIRLVSL